MKVKLYASWICLSYLPTAILFVSSHPTSPTDTDLLIGEFDVDLDIKELPAAQLEEKLIEQNKEAMRLKRSSLIAELTILDSKIPDAYEQTHPAYPKEDLE